MIDYWKGVHPDSGKVWTIDKDIVIGPFWTEDFCNELLDIAKFYDSKFSSHAQRNVDSSPLSYDAVLFSKISQYLFEDYVEHYTRDLLPIINKEWPYTRIGGWQSPFILKYSTYGKRNLAPHHDLSEVSLNIKLNTDYEGADLTFPRQEVNGKETPIGYVTMWPSTVTHHHVVPNIKSGVKYSVTGWTWPSGAHEFHGIKNFK
jgi:hypothetical protein